MSDHSGRTNHFTKTPTYTYIGSVILQKYSSLIMLFGLENILLQLVVKR